jgi:TolA-binding protein
MAENSVAVSEERVVVCQCGAQVVVAGPATIDSVACGNCGRNVRLPQANAGASSESAGCAQPADAGPADVATRTRVAAQLVRDGKYADAAALYDSVLKERFDHRDAFYGLGYCHYKLGNYKDSYRLLGMANAMGHPSAGPLLDKVRGLLCPVSL